MMKKKLLKILFILLVFITSGLNLVKAEDLSTTPTKVSVSPPLWRVAITGNEHKARQDFEFQLTNLVNPKIEYNYLEFDKNQENPTESALLKNILHLSYTLKQDSLELRATLDGKDLPDKTYFFRLEVFIYKDQQNVNLSSRIGMGIPITLTINKDPNKTNPKPDFQIQPASKIFFNPENIGVKAITINQSEKLIDFGGELLVVGNDQYLLYSEKISPATSLLMPKEAIAKNINISELPKVWIFPYVGKLNLSIRATINNERHIQTQNISVWILPYQVILTAVALVAFPFAIYFIRKKYRTRKFSIERMK